jgi:flagellar biosynthesis protein FliR
VPVVTVAQLEGWIGSAFWPFVRIGACLMVAPLFGASYVPRRLRIVIALALTVVLLPVIPPATSITLLSADGFVTTAQQVIIGVAMGFVLQLMFDALTLGGQLLANAMGLGFAFTIDPLRAVTTQSLGQLYVLLGSLTFLALNGHIALIQTLAMSFNTLPMGPQGLSPAALHAIANFGSVMLLGAVRVALPGLTALLVINLAFGVTSRAAPALNLFAVGFPITLAIGMLVVLLGLPSMQSGLIEMLGSAFQFIGSFGSAR